MKSTEVYADFPAEPASARLARRFIDATLREWNCDALLEVATLLVSELVSNAVLHAGTQIRVGIRMRRDRLRVEVQDGNGRLPARKHYSSFSATGRGLLLVERMADQWGVVPVGAGKVVWFELETTASAAGSAYDCLDLAELDLEDLDGFSADRGAAERPGDRRGRGASPGPQALVPIARP
ncbi:MAG: ATP-binding protein [Actinomycetota bacterium]|nr:ATP-binding protein [Actinomycetota bacterium]